jgi:hypothetical protein
MGCFLSGSSGTVRSPAMKNPSFSRKAVTTLIGSIALTIPGFAAVVHDFSGGDGSSNPTQYVGTGGNGWVAAFGGQQENASINAQIRNAAPLSAGGGNYLQRSVTGLTGSEGNTTRRSAVYRRYSSYGDLNTSVAHTISYQWRADEIGSGFNSTGDYFMMFGGNVSSDTGAGSSWMIRYQAASEGGLVGGKFAVYNGNRGESTAYNQLNWVNTDVVVKLGTAYQFVIVNDPVTANWSVSISEVGGPVLYERADLGWRAAANQNANVLSWGAKVTAVDEKLTYSVDSIIIVPEPASTALGALGSLLLFRRKRR